MARQPGARTQVAFAFESVYGTPPASGYRRMPFATTTLGSEQGLLSPELLGYGRDPQAPIRDAVNVDGDVVIPMDAENLGFWLKAIFGQPTTTGTTPRTHTFRSGGFTLPSMAIETQMPDVPRFAMYSGLVADRIQWQSQRSGLLTATVGLIGRGETVAATTAAGVLTDATLPLQRFGNFQGSITRNGAALGNIVSAQVSYANNLDRIETIRNDGLLEGLDPSMAALTGSIEARFADLTLVNQAIAVTPANWFSPGASGPTRPSPSPCTPPICRAPASRSTGRRACRPPSNGRQPERPRPPACAPPSLSTRLPAIEESPMIRLNLSPEPAWLDLGGGVRLRLAPLTSALIGAARSDAQVASLPEDAPADQVAVALAKAIGALAILEWEGVGNAEGYPVPPTPEAVAALLDLFPLFQRFQTDYVAKGLILADEGNASAPLPNGTSAGAKATAPDA